MEPISSGNKSDARVDIGRAKEVREALEVLRSELELPGDVDLAMMTRFGELFRSPETDHMEVIDEDRLAREIAYLTEKWDINEEIVRFRSHVELFLEALADDGSNPVGKRLSFLVQEMHREANTIGSKANDLKISHMAVALKEDVERIREQVENVE